MGYIEPGGPRPKGGSLIARRKAERLWRAPEQGLFFNQRDQRRGQSSRRPGLVRPTGAAVRHSGGQRNGHRRRKDDRPPTVEGALRVGRSDHRQGRGRRRHGASGAVPRRVQVCPCQNPGSDARTGRDPVAGRQETHVPVRPVAGGPRKARQGSGVQPDVRRPDGARRKAGAGVALAKSFGAIFKAIQSKIE